MNAVPGTSVLDAGLDHARHARCDRYPTPYNRSKRCAASVKDFGALDGVKHNLLGVRRPCAQKTILNRVLASAHSPITISPKPMQLCLYIERELACLPRPSANTNRA